mmetsp:Transcript_166849/g.535552  ORF Transcript_166849/g.535552 Transcript_166849/m.535552 type:complete len:259 (+) Transcript_166849:728-1504(+)
MGRNFDAGAGGLVHHGPTGSQIQDCRDTRPHRHPQTRLWASEGALGMCNGGCKTFRPEGDNTRSRPRGATTADTRSIIWHVRLSIRKLASEATIVVRDRRLRFAPFHLDIGHTASRSVHDLAPERGPRTRRLGQLRQLWGWCCRQRRGHLAPRQNPRPQHNFCNVHLVFSPTHLVQLAALQSHLEDAGLQKTVCIVREDHGLVATRLQKHYHPLVERDGVVQNGSRFALPVRTAKPALRALHRQPMLAIMAHQQGVVL